MAGEGDEQRPFLAASPPSPPREPVNRTPSSSSLRRSASLAKGNFTSEGSNSGQRSSLRASRASQLGCGSPPRASQHGGSPSQLRSPTSATDAEDGITSALSTVYSEETCQNVVLAVIVLNMLALSLETDNPGWGAWTPINGLFLAFYLGEAAPLIAGGLLWKVTWWRWAVYDLVVLAVGMIDFAACLLMEPAPPGSSFGILRFLMMTRVLRLYRVIRLKPQLKHFVVQIANMYGMFVSIFGLAFFICFVLSILLTHLLGHGMMTAEDPEVTARVQELFADIPASLFALFQLCTADDWGRIAYPVIGVGTTWRLFFVIFITFMSWTMISLLTAFASETMISASSKAKSEEEVQNEESESLGDFIRAEFSFGDVDNDGLLDKDEFVELMSQPSMREGLFGYGVDVRTRDLGRTWDAFDLDQSGRLTIQELVDGLSSFVEDLGTKHVSNVSTSLKGFTRGMEVGSEALENKIKALIENQDELAKYLEQRQAVHKLLDPHEDGTVRVSPLPLPAWAEEQAPDNLNVSQGSNLGSPVYGSGASAPSGAGGASRVMMKAWTMLTKQENV